MSTCAAGARELQEAMDEHDTYRVAHARNATVLADVSGHTLQSHHGHSTSLLGDASLLCVRHVHNDAALQHLGKAHL